MSPALRNYATKALLGLGGGALLGAMAITPSTSSYFYDLETVHGGVTAGDWCDRHMFNGNGADAGGHTGGEGNTQNGNGEGNGHDCDKEHGTDFPGTGGNGNGNKSSLAPATPQQPSASDAPAVSSTQEPTDEAEEPGTPDGASSAPTTTAAPETPPAPDPATGSTDPAPVDGGAESPAS